MSDTHKNKILGLTVFLAVAGVSLVVTSVASDHWVNSKFEGNSTSNRTKGAGLSFGLFNGERETDFGLGGRGRKLELKCDLSESVCGYIDPIKTGYFEGQVQKYKNGTKDLEQCALFGFALFATNLVMLSLSMVFGLLAIGFTIFNVFGRPIESITGVAGLYLWNAFALIFVLIGIGVYMVLFYTQLTDMMPFMEMFGEKGTDWPDDTKLDWSFFCAVGAAGTYVINILLLFALGKNCACNYMASGEKEVQNDIILY